MEEGFIVQGGHDFVTFSLGFVYWKDAPTVAPSGKEYNGFRDGFKELHVVIFLGPGFFLETGFTHCCSILAAWASKERPRGRNMEMLGQQHERSTGWC